MKNINFLPFATLMILISFATSGFRLIEDVFSSGMLNRVVVIAIVSFLVVFFVLLLVEQTGEVVDRMGEKDADANM
jgi:hypothetical protein